MEASLIWQPGKQDGLELEEDVKAHKIALKGGLHTATEGKYSIEKPIQVLRKIIRGKETYNVKIHSYG